MLGPHGAMLVSLMLIFVTHQAVQSANILALINLASPSHYFFNRAVTRSLAARGHKVCNGVPFTVYFIIILLQY